MTEVSRTSPTPRAPWGIWATLGWVVLAFVVSSIAGFAVVAVLRPAMLLTGTADLFNDGPLISVTNLASAPVQIGALALAARLADWPVSEYLALVKPKSRDSVIAFALLIPFGLGFDGLTWLLGRDVVTPFQLNTYTSAKAADALPLLWLTFVIAVPVTEEIMFRGFLFRGWVPPGRHAIIGILVISALFAVIHAQYDWFGVLQVFLIGLILTWTRWVSGSVVLTMAMHVLINLWAMMETVAKVHWLS